MGRTVAAAQITSDRRIPLPPMHPGDQVPASTSGKATTAGAGAGTGATIGGLIAAIVTAIVLRHTGYELTQAAIIGVVTTGVAAVTGALTPALSAYYKRNYLK